METETMATKCKQLEQILNISQIGQLASSKFLEWGYPHRNPVNQAHIEILLIKPT
jgi:hypothetical protein